MLFPSPAGRCVAPGVRAAAIAPHSYGLNFLLSVSKTLVLLPACRPPPCVRCACHCRSRVTLLRRRSTKKPSHPHLCFHPRHTACLQAAPLREESLPLAMCDGRGQRAAASTGGPGAAPAGHVERAAQGVKGWGECEGGGGCNRRKVFGFGSSLGGLEGAGVVGCGLGGVEDLEQRLE